MLSLCGFYRPFELWKYVVWDSLTYLITEQLTAENNIRFVLVREYEKDHGALCHLRTKVFVTQWRN